MRIRSLHKSGLVSFLDHFRHTLAQSRSQTINGLGTRLSMSQGVADDQGQGRCKVGSLYVVGFFQSQFDIT